MGPVTLQEYIILLRHDILNLLDHANTPRIESREWWKELEVYLIRLELWRKALEAVEAEQNVTAVIEEKVDGKVN